MNIFVTGGTGFVGSEIVKETLSRGHNVAVLSRNNGSKIPEGALLVEGSLEQCPWDKVANFKPDVCIHSAWITTPGVYLESPKNHEWYAKSLRFLLQLPAVGVKAIYAFGTCLEYEAAVAPLEEDAPTNPTITYARCKADLYSDLQKLLPKKVSLGWFRLFYPYGENEPQEKLVTMASRHLINGQKVFLKSPHDRVDFIHVSDVAVAVLASCEAEFTGSINIGSGVPLTVLEIVSKIADITGNRELVEWAPGLPKLESGRIASVKRLRAIGWAPLIPIDAGLKTVIEFNA